MCQHLWAKSTSSYLAKSTTAYPWSFLIVTTFWVWLSFINCQFIMRSSVSKQSDTYHHLLLMFPFCWSSSAEIIFVCTHNQGDHSRAKHPWIIDRANVGRQEWSHPESRLWCCQQADNNPHQNTEAVLQPWLVFNLSADMALHIFYFLLFWRQGFSM